MRDFQSMRLWYFSSRKVEDGFLGRLRLTEFLIYQPVSIFFENSILKWQSNYGNAWHAHALAISHRRAISISMIISKIRLCWRCRTFLARLVIRLRLRFPTAQRIMCSNCHDYGARWSLINGGGCFLRVYQRCRLRQLVYVRMPYIFLRKSEEFFFCLNSCMGML